MTSNSAASHRRRLPHECPPGKALFLTWHLHGSLPSALYPPLGKRSPGKALFSRFMKSLKGFTAREANRFLGRTGQPFWQAESFDHWVRNSDEHARIQAYIEENPVKAGLVQCAEDYRWSSAYRGVGW